MLALTVLLLLLGIRTVALRRILSSTLGAVTAVVVLVAHFCVMEGIGVV